MINIDGFMILLMKLLMKNVVIALYMLLLCYDDCQSISLLGWKVLMYYCVCMFDCYYYQIEKCYILSGLLLLCGNDGYIYIQSILITLSIDCLG